MKLTKYGIREWLGAGMILFFAAFICMALASAGILPSIVTTPLVTMMAILWVAIAAFFRDPTRKITDSKTALISPADGVVRDIELISCADNDAIEVELKELFGGKDILRIGIFLSVFDVHLNRAPAQMTLSMKKYKMGAFHDARSPLATKENESMLIGGTAELDGVSFPLAVRQISGAIARRIVCPVEPGVSLARGERYGMIKFGSRTEIFLPAGKFELLVKVGDRVFGGSSIVANISKD